MGGSSGATAYQGKPLSAPEPPRCPEAPPTKKRVLTAAAPHEWQNSTRFSNQCFSFHELVKSSKQQPAELESTAFRVTVESLLAKKFEAPQTNTRHSTRDKARKGQSEGARHTATPRRAQAAEKCWFGKHTRISEASKRGPNFTARHGVKYEAKLCKLTMHKECAILHATL